MLSNADHRLAAVRPRPALNLDVLRCMVVVPSTPDLPRMLRALSGRFGPLRRAKSGYLDTEEAAQNFRLQLESCRHFAATVYTHLDTYGISVDLVFRLRRLRERVLRIRILMDCLLADADGHQSAPDGAPDSSRVE